MRSFICTLQYANTPSATLALGRHHIGLEGRDAALALQLNHIQVGVFHRHAARRASHGVTALDVAAQEDHVVVGDGAYWETAGSFAVIDLGHGGFERVFPQGHDQGLKSTLLGCHLTVFVGSGCPLGPFHLPDAKDRLQGFQKQDRPVLCFFALYSD